MKRSRSQSYEDRSVKARRSTSRNDDAGGRRYSRSVSRSRSISRSRSRSRSRSSGSNDNIIVLHGLPYSATESEVIEFLHGCLVLNDKKGVHFVYGEDGRVTGDCYVEMEGHEDASHALTKHKEHMGRRWIEVNRSSRSRMNAALNPAEAGEDGVVKLRGLPFECSKEEIASFFLGLAIAPNGIAILADGQGRTSGDGFVKFAEPHLVEKALEKHKEKIRHRYIEVYKSTIAEMRSKVSRMESFDRSGRRGGGGGGFGGGGRSFQSGGGGGRFSGGRFGGGRLGNDFGRFEGRFEGRSSARGSTSRHREDYISHTGHFVHLRGLPFTASEDDIAKFFDPVVPVNIYIDFDRNGRATGEANVDFDNSSDARRAMKKNRNMMRHRYIELFLNACGPSSSKY